MNWSIEAYRQRFRKWKCGERQTHVDFARDISLHFNRWVAAWEVNTYEQLHGLIILEQFKNSVSKQIANGITERRITTVSEAAILADDYALIHRSAFGGGGFKSHESKFTKPPSQYSGDEAVRDNSTKVMKVLAGVDGRCDQSCVCLTCHNKGHREWSIHKFTFKSHSQLTPKSVSLLACFPSATFRWCVAWHFRTGWFAQGDG